LSDAETALEEQRIVFENLQKEYAHLPKDDPKFLGIDMDSKEYWIFGHGWKIKQLGFASKKQVGEFFTRHDAHATQHDELDPIKDSNERLKHVNEMLILRDEMIETCIPMMMTELNGKPFDSKKWFGGDEIPAAAWWDCVRDLFLFLRGRGSREDILLSMMPSSSESSKGSSTTKTRTKAT